MQADDPPKVVVSKEDYKLGSLAAALDNYFRISDRGSTFAQEVTGGFTTFFAMCYILVLNGVIIGGAFNTGIPKGGVFFATALAAGIFTFMMGSIVNVPIALAPGMGLNGYFSTIAGGVCWSNIPEGHGADGYNPGSLTDDQLFSLFPGGTQWGSPTPPCADWGKGSLPWTDAMGAVFISGFIYWFVTFTGLRSMLFRAVPKSLRASIACGIGFFITIIGLKIGKITRVSLQPWVVHSSALNAGCTTATQVLIPNPGNGNLFQDTVDTTGMLFSTDLDLKNVTVDGAVYANITVPILNAFGGGCKYYSVDNNGYDLGMVNFNLHPESRIAVLGLIFVAFFLCMRVKSAIIISIVLSTFVGINYGLGGNRGGPAHGSSRYSNHCNPNFNGNQLCGEILDTTSTGGFDTTTKGVGAVGNYNINGPVNAVTNLRAWFNYNQQEYHNDKTEAQRLSTSNAFFLPNMRHIPSGHLTFRYANTPIFWEAVFTFFFVECFDSFGTITGAFMRAGYFKRDQEKAMTKVNRAMLVDGFGLWLGSIIGSNSITCYIESYTGIEAGARTGFASVVTGSLFLLSLLFVGPFVEIIPSAATTCALVMVGVYSIDNLKEINTDDIIDQLTAFFAIATMAFTYSIANGIFVAFIWYAFMKYIRFLSQKLFLKFRPAWAFPEAVDCTAPHPLLVLFACAFAVRFAYCAPGHQ